MDIVLQDNPLMCKNYFRAVFTKMGKLRLVLLISVNGAIIIYHDTEEFLLLHICLYVNIGGM
jgi:hypothetical protein